MLNLVPAWARSFQMSAFQKAYGYQIALGSPRAGGGRRSVVDAAPFPYGIVPVGSTGQRFLPIGGWL